MERGRGGDWHLYLSMAMAMAYRNWSNKSKAAAHRCQRTGLPEIVKNAPKFRREANQSIKLFKFTAREERESEKKRERDREGDSVGSAA